MKMGLRQLGHRRRGIAFDQGFELSGGDVGNADSLNGLVFGETGLSGGGLPT